VFPNFASLVSAGISSSVSCDNCQAGAYWTGSGCPSHNPNPPGPCSHSTSHESSKPYLSAAPSQRRLPNPRDLIPALPLSLALATRVRACSQVLLIQAPAISAYQEHTLRAQVCSISWLSWSITEKCAEWHLRDWAGSAVDDAGPAATGKTLFLKICRWSMAGASASATCAQCQAGKYWTGSGWHSPA
jgi:hypothetical protein